MGVLEKRGREMTFFGEVLESGGGIESNRMGCHGVLDGTRLVVMELEYLDT